MNLEDLFFRAKSERIADADLRDVEALLVDTATSSDVYRAIHIVGRAGSAERNLHMVAPYLGDDDPLVAGAAVHIIADFWERGEDIREYMVRLLKGIPSDEFGDGIGQALTTAAKYLRQRNSWDEHDCVLFSAVMAVAADELHLDTLRQRAAVAVRSISGADEEDRPKPGTSAFDRSMQAGRRTLAERCAATDGE